MGRRGGVRHPRRYGRPSRGIGKWVFIGIILLVIWLGYTSMKSILSYVSRESGTATLEILQGRSESLLSTGEEMIWTTAFSGQQLLSNDKVRTTASGILSVKLFPGDVLFLNKKTTLDFMKLEKVSSGEKEILFHLEEGEIWSKFTENKNNNIIIETPRSRIKVTGTLLDIQVGGLQDVIYVIKGSAEVELLNDNGSVQPIIEVGVGQKLVVSSSTPTQYSSGKEVVVPIDKDFTESEWNLNHLNRFYPEEVRSIRSSIDKKAQREVIDEKKEAEEILEIPTITSPTEGEIFPENIDTVRLEGTTSDKTTFLTVNGYTLTQYQPGNKRWHYFAAKKFGTLLPGKNTFEIQAITRDGKKSPVKILSIFKQESDGSIPEVENKDSTPPSPQRIVEKALEDLDVFTAPKITHPATLSTGTTDTYSTSVPLVTIRGIVNNKTNRIVVNRVAANDKYQLSRYVPGETEFNYIANADRGNMVKGENIYEIIAFGPDGKSATTQIKIIYKPLVE